MGPYFRVSGGDCAQQPRAGNRKLPLRKKTTTSEAVSLGSRVKEAHSQAQDYGQGIRGTGSEEAFRGSPAGWSGDTSQGLRLRATELLAGLSSYLASRAMRW